MLLVVAIFAAIFAWRDCSRAKTVRRNNNTAIANLQAIVLAGTALAVQLPGSSLNFPPGAGKTRLPTADQRISKECRRLDRLTRPMRSR